MLISTMRGKSFKLIIKVARKVSTDTEIGRVYLYLVDLLIYPHLYMFFYSLF